MTPRPTDTTDKRSPKGKQDANKTKPNKVARR